MQRAFEALSDLRSIAEGYLGGGLHPINVFHQIEFWGQAEDINQALGLPTFVGWMSTAAKKHGCDVRYSMGLVHTQNLQFDSSSDMLYHDIVLNRGKHIRTMDFLQGVALVNAEIMDELSRRGLNVDAKQDQAHDQFEKLLIGAREALESQFEKRYARQFVQFI